jgi:arginine/serine-rich splicing factor 4/5/6
MSKGDRKGDRTREPQRVVNSKYGPPQRTNFRVIVENVAQNVSWQDLKDFMRRGGDVVYTDVHRLKEGEG